MFPCLHHFGFARPDTSLAHISEFIYSPLEEGSEVITPTQASMPRSLDAEFDWDEEMEAVFIESCIAPFCLNFFALESLEAWGNADSADSESRVYYFPMNEPRATLWEFFAGVEQNLSDRPNLEIDGDVGILTCDAEYNGR